MTRASLQQNSFNSGELSPLILGRQDLEKYVSGLEVCHNAVTMVQGAWTRRSGTLFLNSAKFGGDRIIRLIPFEFSISQAYMLEFGHLYIRFYLDGGIVTNTSQTIEDISAGDPGVITITGHGYSNGDRLIIADGGGVTQLNLREVIVDSKTNDAFNIQDIYGNDIDTTGFDAYSTGGSLAEIFELTTTYTEDDLNDIRTEQSADVLYIFQRDFLPATLVRNTAVSWTLADTDFLDGPYFGLNGTATTLGLSATSGSVTVTASAVTGINNDVGFISTDVGRLIRWKDAAGNWTWLEITAFTSTTQVTATVRGATASAVTATASWRLGVFSDTTGFPRVGIFHEDRLWLGGSALAPQTVYASRSAGFKDFMPTDADGTVTDSHAIAFTLLSGKIQVILWLSPHEKGLAVGTVNGEWILTPSANGEALTPLNVTAKNTSVYGSSFVPAVRSSNSVLYIQRMGRKLRELAFVFTEDGFKSPDMTVLSEHITFPQVTWIAFQNNPQPVAWCIRSDGVLIGFTFDRAQGVTSWHRHTLGGTGDVNGGIAVVENVAVIPDENTTSDEVYLTVKRYINGRTERYIEIISKIWETGDKQENAFYGDAGTTFVDSPASDTVKGLWYPEGETLGVWADGSQQPDVTITNGKATLAKAFSVKTLGYLYTSEGKTMPFEGGSRDGSAQGKRKRVERAGFWLRDTLGLKYGPDSASLTEILARSWGDEWGVAPSLFTGVVRDRLEGDYDRLGQIYFSAETMAPATVLSIMPQGDTEDDT